MSKFKIGDIVKHSSGRIGNGKYGEIVDFQGELHVLDNEGSLDMPADANKNDLTVVGTIKNNKSLLNEWHE